MHWFYLKQRTFNNFSKNMFSKSAEIREWFEFPYRQGESNMAEKGNSEEYNE